MPQRNEFYFPESEMASGGGEPKGDAATALAVVAVASEEVEEVVVEEQGITYNDQRSKINDLDLFKQSCTPSMFYKGWLIRDDFFGTSQLQKNFKGWTLVALKN